MKTCILTSGILAAMCAYAAVPDGFYKDNLNGVELSYFVAGGKSLVRGYKLVETAVPTSIVGAVVIPAKLGGHPVTCIGSEAFSGCCAMTSASVPQGVLELEYRAFFKCEGLTDVSLPFSVKKIDHSAFWGCRSLKRAPLGEGVTDIGLDAFAYCKGLTEVTIPLSVTHIGEGAFRDCGGLTSVIVSSGVTSIGTSTFPVATSW